MCEGSWPGAGPATTGLPAISPDNVASSQLASQYGFVQIGEDWDEVDDLGIIYEVASQDWRLRRSPGEKLSRLP